MSSQPMRFTPDIYQQHESRKKVDQFLQVLRRVSKDCNFTAVITHWEKLLDSDWLRDCGFIRNLRANSVIRGKLQISRAKSVIHSQ